MRSPRVSLAVCGERCCPRIGRRRTGCSRRRRRTAYGVPNLRVSVWGVRPGQRPRCRRVARAHHRHGMTCLVTSYRVQVTNTKFGTISAWVHELGEGYKAVVDATEYPTFRFTRPRKESSRSLRRPQSSSFAAPWTPADGGV
jgi:hypothetical protein